MQIKGMTLLKKLQCPLNLFLILAALLSPCVRVIISVILLQYLRQCNTGKYQERLDFVVSKSTVVE